LNQAHLQDKEEWLDHADARIAIKRFVNTRGSGYMFKQENQVYGDDKISQILKFPEQLQKTLETSNDHTYEKGKYILANTQSYSDTFFTKYTGHVATFNTRDKLSFERDWQLPKEMTPVNIDNFMKLFIKDERNPDTLYFYCRKILDYLKDHKDIIQKINGYILQQIFEIVFKRNPESAMILSDFVYMPSSVEEFTTVEQLIVLDVHDANAINDLHKTFYVAEANDSKITDFLLDDMNKKKIFPLDSSEVYAMYYYLINVERDNNENMYTVKRYKEVEDKLKDIMEVVDNVDRDNYDKGVMQFVNNKFFTRELMIQALHTGEEFIKYDKPTIDKIILFLSEFSSDDRDIILSDIKEEVDRHVNFYENDPNIKLGTHVLRHFKKVK
jgi:hypothetical protein